MIKMSNPVLLTTMLVAYKVVANSGTAAAEIPIEFHNQQAAPILSLVFYHILSLDLWVGHHETVL